MPKVIQAGEFFVVGGPVQPERACYVERSADGELLSSIAEQRFSYVMSSRATGKSSLMARTIRRLRREGQLAAVIDLTQIGARGESSDAGRWYYSIAYRIVRELRLKVDLQSWWQEKGALLGDQRLAEFFWEIVLTNTAAPVTIFFDEVERAIDLSFSDELFSAIRSCYVQRLTEPDYMRLNFVVLGVATPAQLCRNPSVSPFDDGQAIELTDFTLTECYQLGAGFGVDATLSRGLIDRIHSWTSGHPYLTQKIARAIARRGGKLGDVERIVHEQFLASGASQEEPLLNHIRGLLAESPPSTRHALAGLIKIAKGLELKRELPPGPRELLQLAGVVTIDAGGRLQFRNQIFARVFDERWARSEMPLNWRLYAAAAAGIAAAFLLPYWYTQVLPRPYVNTLSAVTQDYAVAEAAYERLRRWPGFGARADDLLADVMVRRSERTTTVTEVLAADAAIRLLPGKAPLADEMLAKFWLRQAAAAMHRGDRDVALIYAIEARSTAEDIAIETVSELIGADYPFLERTFRLPQAPISWEVDWERDELVIVDPAHRVERRPLATEASQRSVDAEAEGRVPGRLTAIQHVPVTRELRVDEDGTAGAFNLLITTQHPRAGDLILTLTAPSGAQATLSVPQPRADQHELILSARGDSPLTALAGEETLGQWQLTLVDRRSGEVGVLTNWGLQFRADRQPWQDAPEQGVPLPDPVRTEQVDIALSPSGRIAVAQPTRAGAEGALAVWDLRSGELLSDLPIEAPIEDIVVSAATNRILAVAGDELTVWDVANETPVARWSTDSRFVLQPALSSDERFVMIAEAVRDSVPVFSLLLVATAEVLATFEGVDRVTSWMLGPQARFLAVLDGSRRARIFDPRSGAALAELRHSQNLVRLVATDDDDTLITVDIDGSVHSWPVGTAGETPVLRENRLVGTTVDPASVSLATDVLAFALADGLVVVQDLHDARRPQYLRAHSADRASTTRVAPRAGQLITASGPLFRSWRLEPRPPGAMMERELSAVALDHGGEIAVFGFRGGHVRVRRLSELDDALDHADNVDYIGHRGMVTSLAVNAQRNLLASGGSDGVVRVWNMSTVAPSPHFLRHPVGPVNAVGISADGTQIASAAEYSARIWQAQTGQQISEVPVDGAASAVAFSPDAEIVAVGDTAGNIFFGAPSGTGPLRSVRAHAAVTALAVSPDSARMVSGDTAGNLQLWDTGAGETAAATYLFREPVSWAGFSPDGSAVYARSGGWAHELRMGANGLSVVASHLLPIGVGAGAMPAIVGDSIRWLAGPAMNEPSYADLPMRSAAAAALPADSPQLVRDWPRILGLELDRRTGTVRPVR